jgi:YVTN family beta-propeller protein
VADPRGGDVFQYGLEIGGALSPLSRPSVAAGTNPNGGVVFPNARWVYVTNIQGVAQFDLGLGGLLAPMTTPNVPAPGAVSVAASPDRSSVYVSSLIGTIYQFDVGADGTLSPKDPASITVAPPSTTLSELAVSPDGRSVYVAAFGTSAAGTNLVYQFDVGSGGTLSPKDQPTVSAGERATGLAVSPDGGHVYVTNSDSDTVAQYDVGADGALSLTRTVGAGDTPTEVVVSPDGGSAYVTNAGTVEAGGGSVSQYDVGVDGGLSFKRPGSVSAGRNPEGVGISPDGASVYVADRGAPNIPGALYQFDVASDGTLSAKDPAWVAAGQSPTGVAVSPAFATAAADVLTGTAGDDVICGLGGSDTISGLLGADALYGDRCGALASRDGRRPRSRGRAGHDLLRGGGGRDRLYGGAGRDRLRGGPGRDRLHGGLGRDRLRGGAGGDRLRGGPGRDTLQVLGGGRDRVDCGGGADTIRADRRDVIRSCERVLTR